jgi:flagellar motor switch protein FliN/FliY
MTPETQTGRNLIAQQFVNAWESVLGLMAPVPTKVELGTPTEGTAGEALAGWSWWSLTFDLAATAPIQIGAAGTSWRVLGKLVLGEDDSADAEVEAVAKDLINQCGSVMAQWFSSQTGSPVVCQDAVAGAGTDGPHLAINLSFPESQGAIELLLSIPERLAREAVPAPPPTAGLVSPLASIILPVEVILGRITLELADVLKLSVGTVLDMERHVTEPAEVMVNGRVIAWGHIVMCAGNYGVKITAKAKAQEAS